MRRKIKLPEHQKYSFLFFFVQLDSLIVSVLFGHVTIMCMNRECLPHVYFSSSAYELFRSLNTLDRSVLRACVRIFPHLFFLVDSIFFIFFFASLRGFLFPSYFAQSFTTSRRLFDRYEGGWRILRVRPSS